MYNLCARHIDWNPYALNHSMVVLSAVVLSAMVLKIGTHIIALFRDWVLPGIQCPLGIHERLSGISPGFGDRRLHWDS